MFREVNIIFNQGGLKIMEDLRNLILSLSLTEEEKEKAEVVKPYKTIKVYMA